MKQHILKVVSSIMFVVFLTGIVPKEYLHDALLHHHDDVHPIYKKGELVFTPKHHHCAFLVFGFGPFTAAERLGVVFHKFLVHKCNFQPFYYTLLASPLKVVLLRGPPMAS